MKKLLIFLLLLVTPSVYAEDGMSNHDVCSAYSENARIVMTIRQEGKMPVSTIMASLLGDTNDPGLEAASRLILAAYKAPFFSGDEYKERSINQFANTAYLECYEVLSELDAAKSKLEESNESHNQK